MNMRKIPEKSRIANIVDVKYGKWTVLSYGRKWGGDHEWICQCECGRKRMQHGGLMPNATFFIFNDELRQVAAKVLGADYAEWFESQAPRIQLWWKTGETVESSKESMKLFAEGERKRRFTETFRKSAKQLAVSYTAM